MPKLGLRPLTLCLLLLPACAGSRSKLPTTEGPLDLERVVLYRNGVGYFERHGEFDEEMLHLKVRRDQVDDLLKSLTVVDKHTGKALSVSMPLDPETWATAALATLTPGQGNLASVLDGLRGSDVTLHTTRGRIRGRIVMVERSIGEPDPHRTGTRGGPPTTPEALSRDFKVTLLAGAELRVVRLSKVRGVTLRDGDIAMQLHRRLDASAGQGMFQQIDVDIRLAGAKTHDLVVSYVVSAPMWKPTYRVVLPKEGKGKALLQGWAVVDNTSGEDWRDVQMALTSGEPIAFEYDLHTPRQVDRADLTETGVRKRATVAVGETTFESEDLDESAGDDDLEPEAEEEAEAFAAATEKADKAKDMKKKSKPRRRSARAPADDAPPPPPAPGASAVGGAAGGGGPALDFDSLRRSTAASARAKQVSGMTSFELTDRVTVPNGTSTMVAIINERVEAEQTFLYRPGGAGIGYDANPYRVVRFRNTTPFVLEPGPISIYSGGSFVGEGLSEAVGTKTSATIPFAVEPGIMISSAAKSSGQEMHLLRIVRGVLEVETFAQTTTTWTAKGRVDGGAYTVLIRHPKSGWNYQIKDPPPGTEDLPDGYLVPLKVAKSEASVKVVEQTPSRTTISIWNRQAIGLLEGLLVTKDIDAKTRKKLEPVVKIRQEIGRVDTEIEGLKRQQIELDQRANETRRNLEAIKKDPAAGALRRRLSKRLDEFTKEGDRIGRKVVELQSKRLEKKIELEDLLQDLDFRAPERKNKPKK